LSGKFLIAYLIQKFEMEAAKMEKNTLKIPNISCGHCVNAIKNELTEMKGINSIEGNTEDKTITVEWDTPATLEGIKNKLKEINYPSV
jgi:copper chaperone